MDFGEIETTGCNIFLADYRQYDPIRESKVLFSFALQTSSTIGLQSGAPCEKLHASGKNSGDSNKARTLVS